MDENTWKIAGSTEIEDVEEALGIQIPEGDYNTFAGMILDALGTVPDDGSTVELEANNMQIKVTAVAEHRIEEAVVCLIGGVEEEAAEKAKEEESAKEDRMQARDQANENMNS